MPNTSKLIPFGSPGAPDAREMGRKGGLAKAARKGLSVLEKVYKILESEEEAEAVARAFVWELKGGNIKAARMLFDRQDGPVPKEIKFSGEPRVKLIELALDDQAAQDREDKEAPYQ